MVTLHDGVPLPLTICLYFEAPAASTGWGGGEWGLFTMVARKKDCKIPDKWDHCSSSMPASFSLAWRLHLSSTNHRDTTKPQRYCIAARPIVFSFASYCVMCVCVVLLGMGDLYIYENGTLFPGLRLRREKWVIRFTRQFQSDEKNGAGRRGRVGGTGALKIHRTSSKNFMRSLNFPPPPRVIVPCTYNNTTQYV